MGFRIWKKSKGIWIGKSFPSLLYGFIMLVFIGLLFSQTMGIFVCQLFFDVSFFSSDSVVNILDPSILNSLKLIQFFNAFGVFILPSLFFFHFRGISIIDRLNLNQPLSLYTFLFLFLLALTMIPVANLLGSLNEGVYLPEFLSFLKEIEADTIVLTEQLMKMKSYKDLFQILFLVGILAAFGEELIFRGLLQNLFNEWWANKHLAVWLTALLFSVIHLQYQAVLPRFLLGAIIGYVYENSGNLRSAILLHFFYNSSLVLLTFMIQHQKLDPSWEFVGVENVFLGIFALIFTIYGIFMLKIKKV